MPRVDRPSWRQTSIDPGAGDFLDGDSKPATARPTDQGDSGRSTRHDRLSVIRLAGSDQPPEDPDEGLRVRTLRFAPPADVADPAADAIEDADVPATAAPDQPTERRRRGFRTVDQDDQAPLARSQTDGDGVEADEDAPPAPRLESRPVAVAKPAVTKKPSTRRAARPRPASGAGAAPQAKAAAAPRKRTAPRRAAAPKPVAPESAVPPVVPGLPETPAVGSSMEPSAAPAMTPESTAGPVAEPEAEPEAESTTEAAEALETSPTAPDAGATSDAVPARNRLRVRRQSRAQADTGATSEPTVVAAAPVESATTSAPSAASSAESMTEPTAEPGSGAEPVAAPAAEAEPATQLDSSAPAAAPEPTPAPVVLTKVSPQPVATATPETDPAVEPEPSPAPARPPRPAAKTSRPTAPATPQVRRATNRPPRPPAPPARPARTADGSGRRRLLLGAAGLLLVAAVAAVAVPALDRGGDQASGAGSPSGSAAAPTAPQAAPGASFDPPVELPADGSYGVSQVLASGDLQVTEWIHSSAALGRLRLAVPRTAGLDRAGVEATGLQVAADEQAVDSASTVGPTDPVVVDVGDATSVMVSYRLAGVVDQVGSEAERALARVIGLDVDYRTTATVAVTQAVTGATVLSMACTPRDSSLPVPCGAPVDGVWQVSLAGNGAASRVQAQLELGAG